MIFVNNLKYVKVSKVDRKEKYTKCQLSTSEKKQDGTYEYSNWCGTLVGKAHEKGVSEGEKITVLSGKLSNVYNKEKKVSYLNLTVFDLENGEEKKEDDFSFGSFQTIEDDDSVPF